ncbi:MAG TPA: tubulin-like doman-containing protein [Corynebacterium glutamicum]|nr:tubulin-like doman-containing protein [Corynebacterium glutamicum]
MKKVLVVGCGGSGAKTLAYMMDQLKTTLADSLPERYPNPKEAKLPGAWQFVSVDVPTSPESPGPNLPNVPEAGGRYISCGSSDRYATVDTAVSNQLSSRGALGGVSSWALRNPDSETTPISKGAGQYRSIGRMLILSRLQEIQAELRKSWDVLFSGETERELADLRSALYGTSVSSGETSKEQPIIFVVSSMAGGAGASMALDICRLLTGLEGNAVGLSSLFMVTPDIFSQLSPDQVAGTNPNALAMFAELAAAQMGAASEEDARLFNALGVSVGDDSIPVGRIFPVGIRSGENGALLGDGKPDTVYRALGRGLAALMADEVSMDNFEQFTLGNRGGGSADQSKYAWGAQEAKNIPWGSYGYSQLSMGRDRYAEYAAQRLARSAVDRLLKGHFDPSNDAASDQQLQKRLENNLPSLMGNLSDVLPVNAPAGDWIFHSFNQMIENWTQRMKAIIKSQIPAANGQRGSEWLGDVQRAFQSSSQMIDNDSRHELYMGVADWASADVLQRRVVELLRDEIAKLGVPYGVSVIESLSATIQNQLIGQLSDLANNRAPEAVQLDDVSRSELDNSKGRIDDSDSYIQEIVSRSTGQLHTRAVQYIADHMASVLDDFLKNFIYPLQRTIQREHHSLEKDYQLTNDVNLGISQLKTNVPALWPDESQTTVPSRFSQAANEVFLTDVASFPEQFQAHVRSSTDDINEQNDYSSALQEASTRVVSGVWESKSGSEKAPRDLIRLIDVWVARDLTRDPSGSGSLRDPKQARFELKIDTGEVLERSRQYIRRPGFSFQQFIASSLREFITAPGLAEHERRARRQQVLSKFSEAMTYALPLAQINPQLVRALYGDEVRYNFNFSRIPFAGDELGSSLEQAVRDYPNHRPADISKPLGKALVSQGEERSIDIFGSYPNYAPIVFDSLLPPIEKQWRQITGDRTEFWHGRRTRPLTAALPMTDLERNAMVKGWYIGRLVGRVFFPATLDTADTTPVQIYDEKSDSWINFSTPMLTPVSRFRGSLDWLPNLLESASLAWARAGERPVFESVEPYIQLRQLWDDAASPSLPGRTTRGEKLLHDWLFDGNRMAGNVLQIPGTEAGVTPAARFEAAKNFLQRQNEISQNYVPSDKLRQGRLFTTADRPFGDVKDRELAAQIPVFADLAADVFDGTQEIIDILEKCLAAGPPSAQVFDMNVARRDVSSGPSLPGEGEF